MTCGIYGIMNRKTGKLYVGQSKDMAVSDVVKNIRIKQNR